ncbi:MAG TPA: zinc-binding alcohol dehydrogenase family protein [Solirubrobacteraceae bacterium]|jgi:NADPH2:quinone reductase|nr:zinc-binding alcohol dehydrogenase family protein [Solirubrobacteraceae bacterium]
MANESATVRAARLIAHGEPLRVEEVALPELRDGEVRVRLRYGGVNPIDRYGALGRVGPDMPLPRTMGAEAAGELDGRPVLVAGEGLGGARDGVWAQAAVVPREAVTDVPAGVAPEQAAAMGIAGLTALNCVRDLARVSAEDRVVVLGASGGVGSMIVSLADTAGATVWGQTGSAAKAAGIEEDGADRVIVGGPEEIAGPLAEFQPTVVFDPLGDGFVAPVVEAMAPRGRIVSFGVSAGAEVTFNLQLVYRKMVSLLGYGGGQLTPEERRPGLEAALEAVRAGALRVRVDEVLPLDQVNEAFQRLADRRVQGNLLLNLS